MGTGVDWNAMVLVGRIARPHGVRGQVVVNPETDFVEDRFTEGATFWTRSNAGDEQLTVTAARVQSGRPVVAFDGVTTVDAAERLAGLELRVPEDALAPLEAGTYYHHQLVGCVVRTRDGEPVGEVVRVDGGSAGSLLVVAGRRGEVLIPLATAICVEIDVGERRIRVDPPEGLLELNETRRSGPPDRLRARSALRRVSPEPAAEAEGGPHVGSPKGAAHARRGRL